MSSEYAKDTINRLTLQIRELKAGVDSLERFCKMCGLVIICGWINWFMIDSTHLVLVGTSTGAICLFQYINLCKRISDLQFEKLELIKELETENYLLKQAS